MCNIPKLMDQPKQFNPDYGIKEGNIVQLLKNNATIS